MLVLGLLRRGSHIGQDQPLPVTSPGLPSRSYKAIRDWSLLVLDLELHERGHAANRGQLLPILGLG